MEKISKKLSFTIRLFLVFFWIAFIFSIIFWVSSSKGTLNNKNTLNIFSWSGVIHPEVIEDFEKKYGIQVKVDFFSSNEELLLKLKAKKGEGYDIIIQSDYATQILIKENLLKPLDKDKIQFISEIDPFLMQHDFDPENTYSLPIEWDVCGFGIDSNNPEMANATLGWQHLFSEKNISYKIAMSNDPVEAFCMGAFYLFGRKTNLSLQEAQEVANLLKKQKKWVEAYAVPRSDYLLASKNATLAVALNGFVMQAKKDFPSLKFVPPKDATFISIESISIPKVTTKDEAIYEFLNFIYQKDNLVKCSNDYGFFPATASAGKEFLFKKEYQEIKETISEKDYKLYFFRHLIPENELRRLWIGVKS